MTGLVAGRELAVVVHGRVDQPQRDEPPVDAVVTLRLHDPHPYTGHPRERAHRVEVEVDISIAHVPILPLRPTRPARPSPGGSRRAPDVSRETASRLPPDPPDRRSSSLRSGPMNPRRTRDPAAAGRRPHGQGPQAS